MLTYYDNIGFAYDGILSWNVPIQLLNFIRPWTIFWNLRCMKWDEYFMGITGVGWTPPLRCGGMNTLFALFPLHNPGEKRWRH